MKLRTGIAGLILALSASPHLWAQATGPLSGPQKVIIDTDVGDDIDDAFALGLALQSPELMILQINADFGKTPLRARLLKRFLKTTGHEDIPVAVGVETAQPGTFTQWRYATRTPESDVPKLKAVESTLALIRKYPGQITLLAIGPLTNVHAMMDSDPATFSKLKRVVMMGGSIHVGYASDGVTSYEKMPGPQPEWNVLNDVAGARKLLASGVPVYMMPLDSTQLKLDEVKREALFAHDSSMTDQLLILYQQWGQRTPTLYDPMTVEYAIDPALCPTTEMRIRVDDKGNTIPEAGPPNVHVCLKSDAEKFFDFYMPRLLK